MKRPDPDSSYDRSSFIPELNDFVPAYLTRPDIAFYVQTAREHGGPVLEVGCGTGRILIPTARAGIEIVGLDASKRMLEVCRQRMQAEPPEVRRRTSLQRGDMRDFDLHRRFRLVTLPFRPFQYLIDVDEQLACLRAIRRHLKPDGRLVFDLFNPSLDELARPVDPLKFDEEPAFTVPDGRIVVRRNRTLGRDLANQTLSGELVYDVTHPDGRSESLVHRYRFRNLFRFEVEHLLARAGLLIDHVFADFDRSPYGARYPGELIFVARPSR